MLPRQFTGVRGLAICVVALLWLGGCSQKTPPVESNPETESTAPDSNAIAPLGAFELDADLLRAAALTPEQLSQGWVRLFDGSTLFGWFVVGNANWTISDGVLSVDRGERSYLCTSIQVTDFELMLDFRCDADTNSGIFLRTDPQPEDVALDCLELNIAPPDNPFPTGSFVQRRKVESEELGEFDPTEWHTYRVRLAGDQVQVFLNERPITELTDFKCKPSGHISLQHNSGRVEFRNILFRPIDPKPLALDQDWETDWVKSEAEGKKLEVTPEKTGLRLVGGLGQLQSKQQFDNFVLQASYSLAKPEVNSGIFFRCVPDAMLDGYECQVNHATINGDPFQPADAGAGAIFRRQPARIVLGDGTTQSHITLFANGPQIATWVDGIQVTDFRDTREPDENPRRGLRLAAGPVSLQAHDPETDVVFHTLLISEL